VAEGAAIFDSLPSSKMSRQRYSDLMQGISVVYYDEASHEILTGHSNGSIMIWK